MRAVLAGTMQDGGRRLYPLGLEKGVLLSVLAVHNVRRRC